MKDIFNIQIHTDLNEKILYFTTENFIYYRKLYYRQLYYMKNIFFYKMWANQNFF